MPAMDTPLSPPSAAPAAAPTAAAAPAQTASPSGHPLIWAALLVWLSVEAIGDGLRALSSLLSSATATRSVTPS